MANRPADNHVEGLLSNRDSSPRNVFFISKKLVRKIRKNVPSPKKALFRGLEISFTYNPRVPWADKLEEKEPKIWSTLKI